MKICQVVWVVEPSSPGLRVAADSITPTRELWILSTLSSMRALSLCATKQMTVMHTLTTQHITCALRRSLLATLHTARCHNTHKESKRHMRACRLLLVANRCSPWAAALIVQTPRRARMQSRAQAGVSRYPYSTSMQSANED